MVKSDYKHCVNLNHWLIRAQVKLAHSGGFASEYRLAKIFYTSNYRYPLEILFLCLVCSYNPFDVNIYRMVYVKLAPLVEEVN